MRFRSLPACLLLTAATLVIYLQVGHHDFINLDDGAYVSHNPHVQQGLTPASLRWALTAKVVGNWHPLTVLSHMLDCQLFGIRAGLHHLVNLLLHLANTLLLFFLLRNMTAALWRSFSVALLFAIHPLHVESVAWIAERKDVLSTLFWMLGLLAYQRYCRLPAVRRYVAVLVLAALGLMAKPMVVTLPCVMLLLDWWPLQRGKPWRVLVIEKLPLFALSAGSSIMTWIYQDVQSLAARSLSDRLANALVAYVKYIATTVWPQDLGLLYPYYQIPWWQVAGSLAILGLITALAIRLRHRYPFVIIGWLWYLGTLFPVIGIITVGSQAMADRYTYIPHIGLFIAATWLVWALVPQRRVIRLGVAAIFSAYALMLVCLAFRQTGLWRDNATIYRHTLAVTPTNYKILNNLGYDLLIKGKYAEAAQYLEQSISAFPLDYKPYCNLGRVYVKTGRTQEGLACFEKSASFDPHDAELYYWMGMTYGILGRDSEVIGCMHKAVALDADNLMARNVLGKMLARQGKLEQAIEQFQAMLAIDSTCAEARKNLNRALAEKAGRASP
jgi:tetratricopeptide (TPR) repeat protein